MSQKILQSLAQILLYRSRGSDKYKTMKKAISQRWVKIKKLFPFFQSGPRFGGRVLVRLVWLVVYGAEFASHHLPTFFRVRISRAWKQEIDHGGYRTRGIRIRARISDIGSGKFRYRFRTRYFRLNIGNR